MEDENKQYHAKLDSMNELVRKLTEVRDLIVKSLINISLDLVIMEIEGVKVSGEQHLISRCVDILDKNKGLRLRNNINKK